MILINKLFLLLFADDAVLFSYTKEGIQTLLDKLEYFCDESGIKVNMGKTVVVICQKGPPCKEIYLYYKGEKLQLVKQFPYLGVSLSYIIMENMIIHISLSE